MLSGFLQIFFENSYSIEEKLIKNVEDAAPLVLKDLVQCEEGKSEITVFGVPHILKAGQIIIMQKNVSHSLKALTKLKIKDDFDGCKITAYYARLTKYQFALK
ncbi:hypothetical protein [Treponema succinifaciens]|uniref:hypothetical protein n=1 Tax=Treponema succinifaciens TaxID=167 RepID=UPI003F7EF3BF